MQKIFEWVSKNFSGWTTESSWASRAQNKKKEQTALMETVQEMVKRRIWVTHGTNSFRIFHYLSYETILPCGIWLWKNIQSVTFVYFLFDIGHCLAFLKHKIPKPNTLQQNIYIKHQTPAPLTQNNNTKQKNTNP